jgi:cytochrome c oxidase subunit III
VTSTDLDVSGLGRPSTRNHLLYWGIWWLIVIEIMVFASFASSYLYLGFLAPSWPPDGVEPPGLTLSTINTVILLATIPCVRIADSGVRGDDNKKLVAGLAIGFSLAIAFSVIKIIEYTHFDFRWDSHAYGSTVWALTGFHALHMLALILKTIVILVLAIRGYFHSKRSIGVQVNGLYWYFVVVLWLPIYLLVFVLPRFW